MFDIASVSKQFTAAAFCSSATAGSCNWMTRLLFICPGSRRGRRRRPFDHLMHHTSGIPDYQRLLEDIGFELTERTTQQHAVEALAGARDLDFSPGSDWTYSNSNYVLLAEVVRKVSGQPPGQYLKTKIFEPLNLDMVVEPNALVPGKAVSYQGGSGHYEVVDNQWEQIGNGAIQTTPAELARWGDNYRTAEVGGADWRAAVLANAVDIPPGPTGEKNRYGAGIAIGENGSLGHPGGWEGSSPASGSARTVPPPWPWPATSSSTPPISRAPSSTSGRHPETG